MRGCQEPQVPMLTFVDMDGRVPPDHPLRTIKALADEALRELSSEFDRMYAEVGRPSIPPERLLKASLLIALFSVRSERAFCEELDYNMLYRWFLDMNLLESSFDPTVFTKNRQRLLEHAVGQQLFATVLVGADRHGLLSDEHFTVDGTLIEAAASLKSFKSKGGEPASDDGDPGNPSVDFHGEKRLIVRRVKPTPGSQLALFARYTYHAFITDRDGETLELEADHRRHAEVENAIRDLKYGVGLNHMPSARFAANGAWLAVQVMAHNLARWTARIGLGERTVITKTLRRRVFALVGRITRSARRLTLHLPRRWPWETQFSRALARLQAIPFPA